VPGGRSFVRGGVRSRGGVGLGSPSLRLGCESHARRPEAGREEAGVIDASTRSPRRDESFLTLPRRSSRRSGVPARQARSIGPERLTDGFARIVVAPDFGAEVAECGRFSKVCHRSGPHNPPRWLTSGVSDATFVFGAIVDQALRSGGIRARAAGAAARPTGPPPVRSAANAWHVWHVWHVPHTGVSCQPWAPAPRSMPIRCILCVFCTSPTWGFRARHGRRSRISPTVLEESG
jgi:hypothetical protein